MGNSFLDIDNGLSVVGEVSNISVGAEEFPSDNSFGDLTVEEGSPDAAAVTFASIHSSTVWQFESLSV